ncbi:hypothetical protein WDW89_02045 [Deltaproteobacteria bacterium TL4]
MSKSKRVTSELLTREVAFSDPDSMVNDLNHYLERNIEYDAEYYDYLGDKQPKGTEEDLEALRRMLEKHTERVASMEYYALVRAPSKDEAIPRVADAILLRYGLLKTAELIKEILKYQQSIDDVDRQVYLKIFIHRWVFRFCRHIFDLKDLHKRLVEVFDKEQQKGKEGFTDVLETVLYISSPSNRHGEGSDPYNLRRLYVVFSNLLYAYFKEGVSIPLNLQKIFIEFQKQDFLDYEDLKGDAPFVKSERLVLLVSFDSPRDFFKLFKQIDSPMKKAVFLGMLNPAERKRIIEEFCAMNVKGMADIYNFISKKMTTSEVTEAQGRDWLINVYDTITTVAEEQKVLENQEIPEEIRKVFGQPITFPTPEFRKKPKGIAVSKQIVEEVRQQVKLPPKPSNTPIPEAEGPKVIDIPNLVPAQNLEELRDKDKSSVNIMMVQDSDVLDLIVQNWEIRGSLTFPEIVEFVRIPLQLKMAKAPGVRQGRRFISFAYFIAMGMEQKTVAGFLEKLRGTNQISESRIGQLERIFPSAQEQLAELTDINKDTRKMVDSYDNINAGILLEKCSSLRTVFMETYSYLESLISYWNLIEEIHYSIAVGTAIMGNIKDPTVKDVEHFVQNRNDEYFNAYEKALLFPEFRLLKNFIRKKYNPELQKHFVNVKIKNDLLTIVKTKPVNVSARNQEA